MKPERNKFKVQAQMPKLLQFKNSTKNVSGKIKTEVTIYDMDHPLIYYGLFTTQKDKQPKLNVPLILETRKKYKNSLKISQIHHFTSSICIK